MNDFQTKNNCNKELNDRLNYCITEKNINALYVHNAKEKYDNLINETMKNLDEQSHETIEYLRLQGQQVLGNILTQIGNRYREQTVAVNAQIKKSSLTTEHNMSNEPIVEKVCFCYYNRM